MIDKIKNLKNRYLPVQEMRITAGADQARGNVKHGAIDIGVPVGTPIYAIADGYIDKYSFHDQIYDGTNSKCGNQIVMLFEHDGSPTGYTWANYCHLSAPAEGIKEGDFVRGGTLIGYSGGAKGAKGAGNTTGPHLHLRIQLGDRGWNPKNAYSHLPETYETWFDDASVPPYKAKKPLYALLIGIPLALFFLRGKK